MNLDCTKELKALRILLEIASLYDFLQEVQILGRPAWWDPLARC